MESNGNPNETRATAIAVARYQDVIGDAGIELIDEPQFVASGSSDTWLLNCRNQGQVVLRICWPGDLRRQQREALVGHWVPLTVGYPTLFGDGAVTTSAGGVTWSITRRLEGQTLMQAWPTLAAPERRRAARGLAECLKALHNWRPPETVTAALTNATTIDLETSTSIIGASIHPLPLERLVRMIDLLEGTQAVDPELVREVRRTAEHLAHLAPELDSTGLTSVIHGDLHLGNVWWDGQDVSGLIDLEWVRYAPPWVDLARLLDNVDADRAVGIDAHPQVMAWLREDYPALFAVEQLDDRLRLLQLAYNVRAAFIWPAPVAGQSLAHDHPIIQLRRLVD